MRSWEEGDGRGEMEAKEDAEDEEGGEGGGDGGGEDGLCVVDIVEGIQVALAVVLVGVLEGC